MVRERPCGRATCIYKLQKRKRSCFVTRQKRKKRGNSERKRDSEIERERDRGAIWLDAHHSRTRYFLFITQLILCDKVTTVYRSMVASGWLVFGGAGGSGVCRVFLYIFFLSFFHFLYSFFFLVFVFVHASFPFLAKERGGRRAEDAGFVRKGSKSQTKKVRARFNGAHSTFVDSRK